MTHSASKQSTSERDYNRQELTDLFWRRHGMSYFAKAQSASIGIIPDSGLISHRILLEYLYVNETCDKVAQLPDPILYHLRFVRLGNEEWAYVLCNGMTIVPPFPYCGSLENLPTTLEEAMNVQFPCDRTDPRKRINRTSKRRGGHR